MTHPDDAPIRALLTRLDHPVPAVSAAEVIAAAGQRRSAGLAKLAATLVLCVVAGGVAWAAPASPLRDWARAIAGRIGLRPASPPGPAPAQAPAAGIAVPPGRRFVVVFVNATVGRVNISLAEDTDIAVSAPQGSATFTAEAARLVVHGTAGTTFELRLPRSAPHIEVRAGTRLLLLKEGARITAANGATLTPPLSLDLAPSGP